MDGERTWLLIARDYDNMDKNKFFWNLNAFFYDLLMGEVHNKIYRDILHELGNLEGVRIDDIGCGTGELISMMPDTAIVRGVDISNLAIKKAKRKCTNPNAIFFNMDFYSELPLEYSPDKIVACRSLYRENLSLGLRLLSEHLGESGLAIIVHPKPNWKEYVLKGNSYNPTQVIKSFGFLFSKIFVFV